MVERIDVDFLNFEHVIDGKRRMFFVNKILKDGWDTFVIRWCPLESVRWIYGTLATYPISDPSKEEKLVVHKYVNVKDDSLAIVSQKGGKWGFTEGEVLSLIRTITVMFKEG